MPTRSRPRTSAQCELPVSECHPVGGQRNPTRNLLNARLKSRSNSLAKQASPAELAPTIDLRASACETAISLMTPDSSSRSPPSDRLLLPACPLRSDRQVVMGDSRRGWMLAARRLPIDRSLRSAHVPPHPDGLRPPVLCEQPAQGNDLLSVGQRQRGNRCDRGRQ